MKKTFLYIGLIAATVSLTGCTEDYTDWANPQSNNQEETMAAPTNGVVEAVSSTIDLNSAEGDINLVRFLAADGIAPNSKVSFTQLLLNGEELPFSNTSTEDLGSAVASVNATDIQAAIEKVFFSKAYTTRDIALQVKAVAVTDGVAVPIEFGSNEVNVKVTTIKQLPSIAYESKYYYIGGYNGWNLAEPTPMTDNGDGTYSCIIEIGDSEWFAFAPQSAVDAQDWNALLRAQANGDVNASGFFGESESGFSFCCEKGGKYKFTISPKDWTYSYAQYADKLYYAGDANSWTFSPMVKVGSDFVGYYYIYKADNSSTWGFKFCTADNWDNPQYGAGADGATSIAIGGGNCDLYNDYQSGFYQINVNTDNCTFSVTPITVMSLIGSAVNGDSSWGTDYDLTFNTATMAWEGTYDMTDGEYKIRANHDWALSWGGDVNAMTSQNGANLSISAGKYKFSFKPNCDGQGVLTVEAQ